MNSLKTVYLTLCALVEQSAKRYAYISAQQCANEDGAIAVLFKQLADQEYKRLHAIKLSASKHAVIPENPPDETLPWLPTQRSELVREATESPYLLKSYRALQLLVNDKLWIFEHLTRMASHIKDGAARRVVEELALEELELAAHLRTKRRISYRQENTPQIPDFLSHDSDTPSSAAGLESFLADANTAICDLAYSIEQSWTGELPKSAGVMLRNLHETLSSQTKPHAAPTSISDHQKRQDTDLFFPLRILLRELEATCNMALKIAELSLEEQVVTKAQQAAKTYVDLLASLSAEVEYYAPSPDTQKEYGQMSNQAVDQLSN